MEIDAASRQAILRLARQAILRHLDLGGTAAGSEAVSAGPVSGSSPAGRSGPSAVELDGSPMLDEARGAFVTVRVNGELRGCVGRMVPDDPLSRVIPDLAVSAIAFDTRFPPVTAGEVDRLSLEVSVLTPPQIIDSPAAIEVGRDGLMVHRGRAHGVLLPQVAAENGWDRETFLSWTCRKAGLDSDAWLAWANGTDPKLVVETFTADVFGDDRG
ncbi:MAG: AmmeMemoRadiSam system protein A [Acidobacteriota bacterium]